MLSTIVKVTEEFVGDKDVEQGRLGKEQVEQELLLWVWKKMKTPKLKATNDRLQVAGGGNKHSLESLPVTNGA